MIKVMIVDDEILVRIGLRSTILWEQFGFTVTADAANGEQAIEKFKASDPDILITDIRMPGMDGIELIKVLKEIKPNLKTIILTNYDNFEYAKQALELGADEYLLKTSLDNQTLLPILQKLQEKINLENEKNLEYEQLQKKAQIGFSLLRKNFSERLLTGKINPATWNGFLKELNLPWEGRCFQLVLLKGKNSYQEGKQNTIQALQLIEEITEKINSSLVWESPFALEWVIIYNYEPEKAVDFLKQVIPFNIRQVESCLKQYFQIASFGVCGKPGLDFSQLSDEWQKLREASDYRLFWPEKDLIFYEDIQFKHQENHSFSLSGKNFNQYLRRGDRANVQLLLNELFDKVTKLLSPVLLRQVWHELLGELYSLIREFHLPQIVPIEEEKNFLERFNSIMEIKDWFYHEFDSIMQQIQAQNVKTYSLPIRQAITYLEENYAQDLNLAVLAERVGLSKNHFCTLFRAETGQNFVDYLHCFRLERAKELLETSDLLVYEVALKVGYNDAKYFAKVFQKYHNSSPTEYRENFR